MNVALPFGIRSGWLKLRVAPVGVRPALAMCVAFATMLVAGVQAGREFTAFWRSGGSHAPSAASTVLDPVAHFPQTRVGQLLFASYDDDACRRVLFDNRTGAMVEAGHIFCAQVPTRTVTGADRMLALRKSFGR